jgi:hypothetical protein
MYVIDSEGIKKIKVVKSDTLRNFEDAVNAMLSDGWLLYGFTTYDPKSVQPYFQVMVKK